MHSSPRLASSQAKPLVQLSPAFGGGAATQVPASLSTVPAPHLTTHCPLTSVVPAPHLGTHWPLTSVVPEPHWSTHFPLTSVVPAAHTTFCPHPMSTVSPSIHR